MKSLDELRAAIAEAGDDISDQGVEGVIELIRKILREDLMGLTELRKRLGIKSSAANMRTWRGAAPEPAGRVANGRIWTTWDVEAWIAENPKAVRHNDPQEVA